jgi:molecular chaperone HtpG
MSATESILFAEGAEDAPAQLQKQFADPLDCLRELLQNAIDAVRFQKYLNVKATRDEREGAVTVTWSAGDRLLSVSDNGTGMSLDTIQNHLLRVGSSFYDTPQFQSANADFSPISRFGIGVLTCFMVSDNVEIVTCRDDKAWRIRMSQVQADYLLKELQIGDELLRDLEPHGTRVTLKLRPTIDLNKRSVLDIVRYWVLLPSCRVSYKEGEHTETIGFTTVSDALRHLFTMVVREADPETYDFLTFDAADNALGEYSLAYVVHRSFTSERTFVNTGYRDGFAAATCIEGIRADTNIPGFKAELPTLLSIRGNRRFRTTVSRSNLEHDSEYERFAEICCDALFRHVGQEVQRISSAEGHPLSQASSMGLWVANSLSRTAEPDTQERLDELLQQIPLVVAEEVSRGDSGDILSKRSLRSLGDVRKLLSFWTVESRTVDYLNTISRDLGSDISITQFVASLAPTLFDERVTPLIPDIDSFAHYLLGSHCVHNVEVSQRHQRTVMQWKVRTAPAVDEVLPVELRAVASEMNTVEAFQAVLKREYHQISIGSLLRETFVAPVSGDVADVDIVKARSVTILDSRWPLSAVWQTLVDAYQDVTLAVRERVVAGVAAVTISRKGETDFMQRNLLSSCDTVWLFLRDELSRLLQKREYQGDVPLSLSAVTPTVFNASRFWRDWTTKP